MMTQVNGQFRHGTDAMVHDLHMTHDVHYRTQHETQARYNPHRYDPPTPKFDSKFDSTFDPSPPSLDPPSLDLPSYEPDPLPLDLPSQTGFGTLGGTSSKSTDQWRY